MQKNIDNWLYEDPIAHRGLHNEIFPENTEGAFLNAIAHGHPIETDVHMTIDGIIVIHHDDTLKRSCGVDISVQNSTYNEIKEYCLFNSEYKIMTFKEFLALVDGKVPILLEIKNQKSDGIAEKLIEELKDYKGKIALQSFNPLLIKKIGKLAPQYTVGVLCTREKINFVSKFVNKFLHNLWFRFFMKFDFLSVRYSDLEIQQKRIKNYNVICWTVNSEESLKIAEKYAKNIIFEAPLKGFGRFSK